MLERGSLQYRDKGRGKVLGEFDLRGASQTDCELEEPKRALRGKVTWGVTTSDVGRLELAVRGGGGKPMHERYLLAADTAAESTAWRRAIAATHRVERVHPDAVEVECDGAAEAARRTSL